MQDTLIRIARSHGFTTTISPGKEEGKHTIEACHDNDAVVRTWLYDPGAASGPARMVQIDAPTRLCVPQAMRVAIGQLGGTDAGRASVVVGGDAAQEYIWRKALALASGGQWGERGTYSRPSDAARARMEDASPRRFALQLHHALRDLADAAMLDCVTPELLARCEETLDLASLHKLPVQRERRAPLPKTPPKYEKLTVALERARIENDIEDTDPVPRSEVRKGFTLVSGIKDRGNCTRAFDACLAHALVTGAMRVIGNEKDSLIIEASPKA